MKATSLAGFGKDKERVLWVNVILRAILDATADQDDTRKEHDRREARAWFRANNPDFVEVCNLAGLDPAATIEKTRLIFERYDQAKAKGERFEPASPVQPTKAPRTPRLYTAHGLSMPLMAWSRHLNIAPGTLSARLKRHSPDVALSKDFKPTPRAGRLPRMPRGRKSKLYTVDGVTKTFTEWATEKDIPYKTLLMRLRKGYSMEAALSVSRHMRSDTARHTINGETRTLAQWAEACGISYDALIGRMRKGRTLEEALAMPARRRRRGAGSDLAACQGTGAGSTAQEIDDLDFSGLDLT